MITVERKTLQAAIVKVSKIIDTKQGKIMPVLNNILLQYNGNGKLKLTATDRTFKTSAIVPVIDSSSAEFEQTIDAGYLKRTIRALNLSGLISIDKMENGVIMRDSEKIERFISLQGITADEFPTVEHAKRPPVVGTIKHNLYGRLSQELKPLQGKMVRFSGFPFPFFVAKVETADLKYIDVFELSTGLSITRRDNCKTEKSAIFNAYDNISSRGPETVRRAIVLERMTGRKIEANIQHRTDWKKDTAE